MMNRKLNVIKFRMKWSKGFHPLAPCPFVPQKSIKISLPENSVSHSRIHRNTPWDSFVSFQRTRLEE